MTFAGYGGAPIKAWLRVPAGATQPLPTVVGFQGYSGGRGFAHEVPLWVSAGYAHLAVDARGQGWNNGTPDPTPDPDLAAGDANVPGVLTRGALDRDRYYYRRVYVDAFRALGAAATFESVDPDRLIVAGGSQGGGISIAAAGLAGLAGVPLVAALPDVPFLCDFERSVAIATDGPYPEVERFLKNWKGRGRQVFETLAYFDGVHLGARATCPALFSVGLHDTVCPPSTGFAVRRKWGGPSTLEWYEFSGHEGGGAFHQVVQLEWLADLVGG